MECSRLSSDGCTPFLLDRRQRVKIKNFTSNWTTLNGGMPQGTWLGPYIFLIHISDLQTTHHTFKFIDDVTVLEVIDKLDGSQRQTSIDTIAKWFFDNHMNINTSKTKKTIINVARPSQSATAMNTIDNCPIERVSSFKLLGVTISTDLRWSCHIKELCAKANKRLYFSKLLNRSAMITDDLLQYCKTVINLEIEFPPH